MATKAIDKLRIQGQPAPRRGQDFQNLLKYIALRENNNDSHFIYKGDTGSLANGSDVTTIIHSHPSSAASRKYDHLQRVQQANRGLSSADFGSNGREGLPSIHFFLQGKPVQGDMDIASIDASKHQRVGHYKTSAKEVYRARHRMATETSINVDHGNYFRAIRTPFHDPEANSGGLSSGTHFYLGPSVSGQAPPYALPSKGPASDFTSSSLAILNRNRITEGSAFPPSDMNGWNDVNDVNVNGDVMKHLENVTNPGPTPRGSPQADDYHDFGDSRLHMGASRSSLMAANAVNDLWNPNPTPVGNRHRQTPNFSRRSQRDAPKGQSDPSSLRDCLRVHPSYKIPLQKDMSPRDLVRLKHGPQAKINYNNPYRNLKSKERTDISKSAGRYIFNSVESYIHFNKIYPRSSDVTNHDGLGDSKAYTVNGLPQIPKLNGFTSHCTDTMMLKMMFEMNKPKSVKSVSKYSDVAVHKDLDEFMIVSTPTVSRSASVVSRRTLTPGLKKKSQRSVLKKKIEKEHGFESKVKWEGNDNEQEDEKREETEHNEKDEEHEEERSEGVVNRNYHSESKHEQGGEVYGFREEQSQEKNAKAEGFVTDTNINDSEVAGDLNVGPAADVNGVSEDAARREDGGGVKRSSPILSEPLLSKTDDVAEGGEEGDG